jgi:hypothetical protein
MVINILKRYSWEALFNQIKPWELEWNADFCSSEQILAVIIIKGLVSFWRGEFHCDAKWNPASRA